MTYWADNIKFIKDIQDSKYKKIEDNIAEVSKKSTFLSGHFENRFERPATGHDTHYSPAQTLCEQ